MSRILTWARLSLRIQRLEILLLGAAVLVASGLMLWWASLLVGISNAYPDCDYFDPAFACDAAGQRFSETFSTAELIIRNTWVAGFALGLLLGVPIVAREVEHGTAQLAWTLSRSHSRWLLGRVAFAALVALVLGAALAITTEVLATAMRPDIDMTRDFNFYGNRGPLIVGRTMLGLGAGVLVGALVGRQLPALILGVLVIGALYAASTAAFPAWYRGEAEVHGMDEYLGGPLWIESGVETPNGERLTWAEVYEGGGSGDVWSSSVMSEDGTYYATNEDLAAERNPLGRDYILIIPGERYNEIVARETAVFSIAGLVLIAGAAAVTRRRRPT
jgi:hypothetical protein